MVEESGYSSGDVILKYIHKISLRVLKHYFKIKNKICSHHPKNMVYQGSDYKNKL